MSNKHLCTGDPLPPLAKDTWRLYSMRLCPFAQRTRMVLEHKQIPYETVNISLNKKPDWFFEKNALGKVPVLEKNDQIINESAICDELLDEVYPEPPLFPKDPFTKAHIKVLMEHYSKVVPKFYAIRRVTGEERDAIILEMQQLLDRFEKELGDKKFFGGDCPNMLDYHMWPWFERIEVMEYLLPKDKLPRLLEWTNSIRTVPAVKATVEAMEMHKRFIDTIYVQGKTFDYGTL